ncbi:hypothetical protein EMIT0P2_20074 [Pseudomonas sp. IT-P2]
MPQPKDISYVVSKYDERRLK